MKLKLNFHDFFLPHKTFKLNWYIIYGQYLTLYSYRDSYINISTHTTKQKYSFYFTDNTIFFIQYNRESSQIYHFVMRVKLSFFFIIFYFVTRWKMDELLLVSIQKRMCLFSTLLYNNTHIIKYSFQIIHHLFHIYITYIHI